MKKRKRQIIMGVVILFLLVVLFNSSFARYIYNNINNRILESQGFYFNSSILKYNGATYSVQNWDGVNPYTLTVDVNNRKNDRIYTKSDISYDISVECSNNVTCSLNKQSGIIYESAHNDSYIITVIPKSSITEKETVTVKTEVESTRPYQKRLYATYNLGVEKSKFSYEIVDEVGSKYLSLKLTNSIAYYKVMTAFSSYSVGDVISLETYKGLSAIDKKKCFSAKVKISFPTNQIYLDMTDRTYLNRITNTEQLTTLNGFQYISGYQFYVLANSDTEVRFYKKNISENYTYPIIHNNSIINVEVQTAAD